MEKLSIAQASKQFSISRARLYQLLDKGTVVGHKSMQKGRGAGSWIDVNSLTHHIETRDDKKSLSPGRHKAMAKGNYLPVREAAKKAGYSTRHVYLLINQGIVAIKNHNTGKLVYCPDLLTYKNNK